jgi:hypothetical protein
MVAAEAAGIIVAIDTRRSNRKPLKIEIFAVSSLE